MTARGALFVALVIVSWFWFDSWNGAWVDGYRSGRCEAKCGFEPDEITFVAERHQIVCRCRDGSLFRLAQ